MKFRTDCLSFSKIVPGTSVQVMVVGGTQVFPVGTVGSLTVASYVHSHLFAFGINVNHGAGVNDLYLHSNVGEWHTIVVFVFTQVDVIVLTPDILEFYSIF